MFGISLFELITVLVLALILFGPDKLPEAARTIGKLMGELRKSSDSLRREFYNSVYTPADDLQQVGREMKSLIRFEPGENCESPPLPEPPKASEPQAAETQAAPINPDNKTT